jgi:hypothetical protein
MMRAVSSWTGGDAREIAEPNGPDPSDRSAFHRCPAKSLFVWGFWGLTLLGNFASVVRFAIPDPRGDGIDFLSTSLTAGRLRQPHAEHRARLAKLIWLAQTIG